MKLFTAALAASAAALLSAGAAAAQWNQWGGPGRDFAVRSGDLTLPEAGPRMVWKRDLGDGESAILVDGGLVFVMYRHGSDEVVAALRAGSGEPVWEHRYAAPIPGDIYVKHADGPHATPLIAGDRLFTFGITGQLHALDVKTGKVAWSHDVMKEHGGKPPDCGYSSSPLAHGDNVIVQVGGKGQAVVAFRREDGAIAWKSGDHRAGYAAPLLIDVGGEPEVVAFMYDAVAGFDPATGELLWSHPHETSYGANASAPLWGEDGVLVISSAYDNGSRGLRVRRTESGISVKELWSQKKLEMHFTNAVRVGDHVYGTSGDFGPVMFTAVDAKTGELLWQKRDVAGKAHILRIGQRKLLLIDETGKLLVASVSPEGVEVHRQLQLLEGRVWAPPTLVGDRLYVRNRKSAFAFDLG